MLSKDFIGKVVKDQEMNLIGPVPFFGSPNKNLATILIDGGAVHRADFYQSIAVGDGDSSTTPMDVTFSTKKNFSDLAGAIQLIEKHSLRPKIVHCWGLLDGRKDHEFSNLLETYTALSGWKQSLFHFYSKEKKALSIASPGDFHFTHHGIFSIFQFNSGELLIEGNCSYPVSVKDHLRPFSSHGLSNEANGQVHLSSEVATIIYYEYE